MFFKFSLENVNCRSIPYRSKKFGVQLKEAVVPTLAACILAAVGILDCILCAVLDNKVRELL